MNHFNFEDWKNQALKELKGDDYDNLLFQVDEITLDPYADEASTLDIYGKLPKLSEGTSVATAIDLTDEGITLAQIQSILDHESHIFFYNANTSNIEIVEQLDFNTTPIFVQTGQVDLQSIGKKNNLSVKIIQAGINYFEFDLQKKLSPQIKVFKKLGLHDDTVIAFILTGDIVRDTIKCRAFKMFWLNTKVNQPLYTSLGIIKENIDFPMSLIQYSDQYLTSIFCQCDFAVLKEFEIDREQVRLARNVAHIGRIESTLSIDTDPIAGSYFVEKASVQLAQHLFLDQ